VLQFLKNGYLQIPHHLTVEIKTVGQDCYIRGLDSKIVLDAVGGDLHIQDAGPVSINKVGQDFSVRRIRGDLSISTVGGEGYFHDIDGQISAPALGGDLTIKDCGGGVDTNAGGDTHITFSPVPWQAYHLKTGGDLYARVPEDTQADFSLRSSAGQIHINQPDQSQKLNEEAHEQKIGEGGPSIKLSAGGELFLTSGELAWIPELNFEFAFAEDLGQFIEDITNQTSQQLTEQLASLENHLNIQLSDLPNTMKSMGLSEEKMEEIQRKIEKGHQRAAQKIKEASQKAQIKIQQKAAAAQDRARRKNASLNTDLEDLISKADSSTPGVSDEERLAILKMLQEKKIDAQQADDLLSALEEE
jgi:hypothetical protein